MTLTLTDLFCGAGGSSSGAIQVPGVEVRMAANHWDLAIRTHNTNHPNADHDCADISQVDPRRYPATDLLWSSPECTNHSQAKGRKLSDQIPDLFGNVLPDAAAERSRATMWDVPRFIEASILRSYPYKGFVVENVVDVRRWMYYDAWRSALDHAGYCLHSVYLNSMFAHGLGAPAPQSRDRYYCLGHLKGTPCPDLDKWTRPRAWCPACETWVRAVQAWKNVRRSPWGRYRAQYVYRCPNAACRNGEVFPPVLPAASVINWDDLGVRIGDRARPLAAKTIERIEAALARYGLRALAVPVEGRQNIAARPMDLPLRTQTGRLETALVVEMRNNGTGRPVSRPLSTVCAAGNHHGFLIPAGGTWNDGAATTIEPFRTRTTRETEALVSLPWLVVDYNGPARQVGEPLPTQTTVEGNALASVEPAVDDCMFRMLAPSEIQGAMAFDAGYRVLGNKREMVRQLGNAVTPPAARDLVAALVESITGEDIDRD